MSHLHLALERFKKQQKEQPSRHGAGGAGQNSSLSITYTHTRSIDIPEMELQERRVLSGFTSGPFVDAYKILRTQVVHRLRENHWNTLGITSPGEGEGKTLTAVNLALSLAMEVTQTVLLVDANLRNPTIHQVFGLGDCAGLADYLLDDIPVADLLVNPGIDRFVLMPGGRAIPNSAEFLTSPKMVSLVDEFKNRYQSRIIIFDLPPLLQSADVLAFSPYTDAILLVVEEGKTTVDDVTRAMELTKKSTPILGTVLNKGGRPGLPLASDRAASPLSAASSAHHRR
ncbi:MAG: CpsD/CapB family tyrosine-protein kinase [Nitrospiraceae bacterium]